MFRGDPPPRYARLDTPAGGYLRWAGDRPAVTLERVDVGRELPGETRRTRAGVPDEGCASVFQRVPGKTAALRPRFHELFRRGKPRPILDSSKNPLPLFDSY